MKLRFVKMKLISICEIRPDIAKIIESDFKRDFIDDEGSQRYYRDTYFNEFMGFMYPSDPQRHNDFQFYSKRINRLNISDGRFEFSIDHVELVKTPNQLGIFSINIHLEDIDVNDLTFFISKVRSFDLRVNLILPNQGGDPSKDHVVFSRLLEEKVLGFNFRQDSVSDLYSGSKFKVFLIAEYDDLQDHIREHILYDIATSSPLGSGGGQGFFAPHLEYYNTLTPQFLRAFNNYEGLILLDSFVVIGESLLTQGGELSDMKIKTWDITYFRLYLYVLYLKYSLYRFNSMWKEGVSESFAEFERFYYEYNITHISFNFLPQLIHDKIRLAIGVNQELDLFKERMKRLSERDHERQAKKQARLIQVASTGVVIASVPWSDLYDFFEKIKISPSLAFGVSIAFLLTVVGAVWLYNRSEK